MSILKKSFQGVGSKRNLAVTGVMLVIFLFAIDATIVAGQVVLRDNEHTGALPGRVIRGPLAAQR